MTTDDRPGIAAGGLEQPKFLWFRRTVVMGSVGSGIIAIAGLLGYVPGLWVLASIRSDYIPMAPSTAGCFIILSVALFRYARKPWQGSGLVVMLTLVFLATMFSLLDIVGSFAGMDLNFEERLFSKSGTLGGKIPIGQMSPSTGAAFVVSGLATFLLLIRSKSSVHFQRFGDWISSLGALMVIVGSTVLLAYLYGTPLMYSGTTIPMAATTAIGFMLLGAALIASVGPDSFPMCLVTGDSTSARLTRVFLPLTVAIVLIQSILSRFAAASSVVNDALLLAVLVVVVGIITSAVIARISNLIGNSLDALNLRLLKSEEQHRIILQTAMDGFWQVDTKGRILEVNETYCHMSGYSAQELLNMHIADLDIVKTDDDIFSYIQNIMVQGSNRFESKHRRKDGSVFDVEISAQYRSDEGGRFVVFLQDITARKRAEDTLAENEAKLRSIMDNIGIGVSLISPDMEVLELNQRMREWFPVVDPGQHPFCYRAFHEPPRKAICDNCPTQKTLQDGLVHEDTRQYLRAGGARDYRIISSPSFNASGAVAAVIEMVEDITEKLSMESQLRQAMKMESVGRLAGGVAHDFSNMLNVIIGFAELAMENVSPEDSLQEYLKEIVSAGRHSVEITKQLLAFARKQIISPEVIDLNETIEGMLNLLRSLIGENLRISWLPGSVLWPVFIDPTQVNQILANLCVNARDAIADVGTITIETENVLLDELYCADHMGFVPGEYVQLTVSDTGCGMDRETQDKIFEPFFTTKGLGKGTGLGMAMVYGIVKQNNGFIDVDSELKRGTIIKIYLPRHQEAIEETPKNSAPETLVGHGETILIVEDETPVLNLARIILKDAHYTPLTAETADRAIRLAREHADQIQLLITDVIMPEMNGRDLAAQVQTIIPGVKCLFMSGYTADAISDHGVLEKETYFLQKPFSRISLIAKVRELVGSK